MMRERALEVLSFRTTKAGLPWVLWLIALGSSACVSHAVQGRAVPVEPGSVPPPAGGNLLKVATFDSDASSPWSAVFSAPGDGKGAVKDGAYCLEIRNAGQNRWDAQVRHREMVIQRGHRYTVQFRAWASQETDAYPKVGMSGPPYTEYFGKTITLLEVPQSFRATFDVDAPDDPTAELAIHVGGGMARGSLPLTICIDDVYLTDLQLEPVREVAALPRPRVRVNQVGYLPRAHKIATVVSDSEEPLKWKLRDASGGTVTEGGTTVFGDDASSGDYVHQVDFGPTTLEGRGFVLQVGDGESDPFDIEQDVYEQMKYDALAYFYHNRSGIPIEMPYAGEEKWTRPAGHRPDKARCTPQQILDETGWDVQACDYELDVTGGWYDAGDHGKYVVNGGIATWTLLNLYERFTLLGKGTSDFEDRKLNIPEAGNGVPDILDEARWQLEFMLKMQVTAGEPLAGMVHHKVHDDAWTGLPLAPHDDTRTRYLRPPSTAATLNLAASAAQAARIFKAFDVELSRKLLTAAESAYAGAKRHPILLAPDDGKNGGGPYNDDYVDDDFYWAAAELYITTGEEIYKTDLSGSRHHTSLSGADGIESIMTWGTTDGLGAISLAVADSRLSEPEKQAQRRRIIAVADRYLEAAVSSGYRTPFEAKGDRYPWGSNSFVLNNMLVLALAHDFTRDERYFHAVVDGMDYLLGRNAMAQSYVTGYGERPLEHPHHRFWARQASDAFPEPPPGAISGGPNSGLEDPYTKAAGLEGCRPQKCFVDHIAAFSTNEITINWNAPFVWVAAWLDEHAR
jgi:endoglucanase